MLAKHALVTLLLFLQPTQTPRPSDVSAVARTAIRNDTIDMKPKLPARAAHAGAPRRAASRDQAIALRIAFWLLVLIIAPGGFPLLILILGIPVAVMAMILRKVSPARYHSAKRGAKKRARLIAKARSFPWYLKKWEHQIVAAIKDEEPPKDNPLSPPAPKRSIVKPDASRNANDSSNP